MKLKDAIKEIGLQDDDTVFIHIYGKVNIDRKFTVGELDSMLLKKKVRLIQGNFGGMEHDYKCYRFILN